MAAIKPARHVILLWMNLTGFRGITLPWAIYLYPTRLHDAALIRHEMKHVEQMRREGVVKFFLLYLWWSLRYGYRDNPYEQQARAAEAGWDT